MARALEFDGRWKGPRDVGTRTLGTAWRDIGTKVTVGGALYARAYLSMQIHAGTDARFRLVSQYTAVGSAFGLGSGANGTGITNAREISFQTTDADQRIALEWELNGTVPFAKLQGIIAGGSATYVSQAQLVTSG